jgi:hypothetical protein
MLIGEGKKEENNIRKNYLIKSVEDIPDEFWIIIKKQFYKKIDTKDGYGIYCKNMWSR